MTGQQKLDALIKHVEAEREQRHKAWQVAQNNGDERMMRRIQAQRSQCDRILTRAYALQ